MSSILNTIQNPSDLKRLSFKDLTKLAEEIREGIILTVSKNGGHLASNLGVVELTIALHLAFDMPKDKIIFDVGHQSYTHKLLTGRKDNFHTLRQYQGISGFPQREESSYDVFNTGHSSTSISAALGLAIKRDFKKEDGVIVAVVGDGALTAGIALEALNHVGFLKTNLIIVLNDNEKSISKNVGALSVHLGKLRAAPFYLKAKKRAKFTLRKIPVIGNPLLALKKRLELAVKQIVIPTKVGIIFEELGFTYLGPVDGHDLSQLRNILESAKSLEGPVLVHVKTQKGKGCEYAERDSTTFHSVSPFNPSNGEIKLKESIPSYTQVFSETLIELAKNDKRIVAITAAMPDGTGLSKFKEAFPKRFFDVGIAEQHAVTLAAGLATAGLRPVVAIYSTFLQRAYDQIVHDVCLQNLPVVFAIDRAGIVGEDGATHQGIFDFAYLRHIPNIVVMAPKDENELQHMLNTAINYDGPIAFRYPRGSGLGVNLDRNWKTLPIGKGEILREGEDLAIFAIGSMVCPSLEAATRLAEDGIEATVVNARFVKPIDKTLIIEVAKEAKQILTVEEHSQTGGFGSAVLESLTQNKIKGIEVETLGLPDHFIEHGAPRTLKEKYKLTAEEIAKAIIKKQEYSSYGMEVFKNGVHPRN